MSRLGVHGAVKNRLGIPPYGSNPRMPLKVFQQTFGRNQRQLPEGDPGKALRNGTCGKPPVQVPDEDWALAFTPSPLEDGECAVCRGKGFIMRPWKEGKITLESRACAACAGTGKTESGIAE